MNTLLLAARRRLTAPLVIPGGTLCATQGGILTKLQPPLSRLSGYVPWRMVPGGFAALRILAGVARGDDCDLRTVRTIETYLKVTEMDCKNDPKVKAAFEESDAWCDDVERIIRWGIGIADRCPDVSVAKELVRLPKMTTPELHSYLGPWLS